MTKKSQEGITAKKEENMPEWYTQVCLKSELADFGSVKGTMVIRPLAYSIWEKIQEYFNNYLKKKNIPNAYYPMFIPEKFFKKEAEHAKGFTPEVAWIENKDEKGQKIALRPTSETIIYDSYAKWIRSWRDLPFKTNQWCNIVRWEVSDCKLFLRSREFLWQEGHCVYETEKECDKEVWEILKEYEKICKELLALPTISGQKTEKEKFAGAKYTTTVESFMPDGKALQCGTSHNLGQGFAKSFGIEYKDKNEKLRVPWQNSWGFSTRLIGATIMTHSDNKGLVLPPKIAPIKAVIIPILFKGRENILKKAEEIEKSLKAYNVKLDSRTEQSPGWKFNEWELKGVPLRIEIGPKDLAKKSVTVVKRNDGKKLEIKISSLKKEIPKLLEEIQKELYEKAEKIFKSSIKKVSNWKDFTKTIKEKKIALAPFCGETGCEDCIKEKTGGASSRCIAEKKSGKCVHCNKPAKYLVYFSKSY